MRNKKKLTMMIVIYLIGFIPLITANTMFTNFAIMEFKKNMIDSTYLKLRACATSVEQYFSWDIREDILCKDDVSYEFIDSLKDSDIEQTFLKERKLILRYGKLLVQVRNTNLMGLC